MRHSCVSFTTLLFHLFVSFFHCSLTLLYTKEWWLKLPHYSSDRLLESFSFILDILGDHSPTPSYPVSRIMVVSISPILWLLYIHFNTIVSYFPPVVTFWHLIFIKFVFVYTDFVSSSLSKRNGGLDYFCVYSFPFESATLTEPKHQQQFNVEKSI